MRRRRAGRPFIAFWLDVALAAILGKLGRIDEAQGHIRNVVEMKPDFANRARELLRRTVKIDPLIEDLIGGLRAADLSISD